MTSPAKDKPKECPKNIKQRKANNKKLKQRAKRRGKNCYQKPFKEHMDRLNLKVGNDDIKNEEEVNKSLLENASYSMMHSLADGFSIVLYSGTHQGLSRDVLHRNDAVRLILGPDMVVVWHEGVLHSGAKTRSMGFCGESMRSDLRFFSYVWPSKPTGTRNGRGRIRVNDGNNIHRLKSNLCDKWSFDDCKDCVEGATVIDLTSVTGYAIGDKILGDLGTCGWVVLRGVSVTDPMQDKMEAIAKKGRWKSISTETHRLMKYTYQSKIPLTWNDVDLLSFRSQIETRLLSQIPHTITPYIIGKFNLLMNGGLIKDDQDPHFDYPPKVVL
jgi:hypothetical protein